MHGLLAAIILESFFFFILQIPIAVDMAKDFKGKDDEELFKKMKNIEYMCTSIVECYEALRDVISV